MPVHPGRLRENLDNRAVEDATTSGPYQRANHQKVDLYLAHLAAGTTDTLWLDGPQYEPLPDG